jgi:predicted Na+-dependent transporter
MWNTVFFVYSVVVLILSAVLGGQIIDTSAKRIKYLNEIALAISVALTSFIVGVVFGQHKSSDRDFTVYARAMLLVFILVLEGLLIDMVSRAEFSELSSTSKTIVFAMLGANSLGIAGAMWSVATNMNKGSKENRFSIE